MPKLPKKTKKPTVVDDETFEIINRISEQHSGNIFGYLTKDDLKSEIWRICLEKIDDFDKDRGDLEHFLRVLVKNRLINVFKDVTKSVRSPCPRCPYYDPGNSPSDCARYGDNRELCNKWKNYELSVKSRNSLLNTSEPKIERNMSENVLEKMIGRELQEDLLDKIDKSYHRDINELISGGKIAKQRLKRLKKEISRLLNSSDEYSDEY